MFITLTVITVALVVVTLLPISRYTVWWVRGWDFPRLQLFVIAAASLTAQALLLDIASPATWALLIPTLACALYQAWWIWPYTRLHPTVVQAAGDDDGLARLTIVTSNVLMTNRDAAPLLHQIRQYKPDILVTLETDKWWEQQLAVLEGDYPHSIKCPLDNLYGMHVYSRLPLHDSKIEYLVEPDAPSMHAQVELAGGHAIRMHFLHPAPPSPTENPSSQERDAELVVVARSVAQSDEPIIVTGDLNDVAWSRTTRLFRKISGLLDPRVGRGMFNTFHADYPFARWPLDHLFHSRHFRLKRILRLGQIGSDHFPLLTELVYYSNAVNPPQTLDTDAEDREIASDMAAAENVTAGDVPRPEQPH